MNHEEFGGMVSYGAIFTDEKFDTDRCDHGTHVAAIVTGRQFGVSRTLTSFP